MDELYNARGVKLLQGGCSWHGRLAALRPCGGAALGLTYVPELREGQDCAS